jgi:hypothetical protein
MQYIGVGAQVRFYNGHNLFGGILCRVRLGVREGLTRHSRGRQPIGISRGNIELVEECGWLDHISKGCIMHLTLSHQFTHRMPQHNACSMGEQDGLYGFLCGLLTLKAGGGVVPG